MVESMGTANTKRDHVIEMPWSPFKELNRRHELEEVSFCLCYKILNTMFGMTRKQVLIHIFLHILNESCFCGHHQQSRVTTPETVK